MPTQPFLRGLTVALASNAHFDRWIVPGILRSAGSNRILVARSRIELREQILLGDVDLLILDNGLDGCPGSAIAKELRRNKIDEIAFLPIICLIADATRRNVMETAQSGVHEIVTKPYSAKTLLDRLYWTVKFPRAFIRTADYFGPEPRSLPQPPSSRIAPPRRLADQIEIDDEADTAAQIAV